LRFVFILHWLGVPDRFLVPVTTVLLAPESTHPTSIKIPVEYLRMRK
jgi:hypothetical protein